MKNISLFLCISLLLSACSINFNTQSEDLFKKKQECAKHKDEMLKEAIEMNAEWMAQAGHEYDLKIEEILYSKTNNSCLYVLSVSKWTDILNNNDKILLFKSLHDFLSKQEIMTTLTSATASMEEDQAKKVQFEAKIKELKGE